jgi:MFS family permease
MIATAASNAHPRATQAHEIFRFALIMACANANAPPSPMTSAPFHARVFYGWIVVGAAFVVLFLAYGLQFCYGVFVTGMVEELGWDRATAALPYSIYVFAYSALSAATGKATDRYGPRQVITLGAVLLGAGWGASAFITTPSELNLTLGVVAALGMSVAGHGGNNLP